MAAEPCGATNGTLLDDLVGDEEELRRDCQAERLRGLEVNRQIKFARLAQPADRRALLPCDRIIAAKWTVRLPHRNRLIGNHQIARRAAIRQRAVELTAADIKRLAGVALLAALADANDGGEASAPGGFGLLADQRIALTMIGAPLGMADDNCAAPITPSRP